MARRYDPEQARAEILEAASQCFFERGYARTSLRRIAERAEVPHSLISYHFQSKEGLAEAVIERLFGWIGEWVEAWLEGRTPSQVHLATLAAAGVEAIAGHPETFRSRLGREVQHRDRLRERIVELLRDPFQEAVRYVERGIEVGVFQSIDPAVTVALFLGAMRGYFEDADFYSELAGRDLASPAARSALQQTLFGIAQSLLEREE